MIITRLSIPQWLALLTTSITLPLFGQSLETKHYNVLFIMVDDLKPKLHSFGAQEMITPKLDDFASTAVTFTQAYCQQALCGPSRASIISGLRPDTTGVWTNPAAGSTTRDAIDPDYISLPQHFGDSGYHTYGISKIVHGGNQNAQDANISYNDGWQSHGADHIYYGGDATSGNWFDIHNGLSSPSATDAGEINYWTSPPRPVVDSDYPDGSTTERAISQLTTYASDFQSDPTQNFFMAIGFTKPHLPFACPKSYWDLYDPSLIDLDDYDSQVNYPVDGGDFTGPPISELTEYADIDGVPDIDQARRLIHGYMACVTYIDTQIGKILDSLDTLDPSGELRENTIVVITGDHGWHLGDHGAFWTKNTNFEEATRTPLMIRVPGMDPLNTAGTFCEKPVELISLYPTLVDLNGLSTPSQPNNWQFEGPSIRPLLENPTNPNWNYAAFSQYHKNIEGGANGWGMGYSLRTERYRYTEWYLTDRTNRSTKDSTTPVFTELYDHSIDPDESINRASHAEYASTVSTLSAKLDGGQGWTSQLTSPAPIFTPSDELSLSLQSSTNSTTLTVSGQEDTTFSLQHSSNLSNWVNETNATDLSLDTSRRWTHHTTPPSANPIFYRAVATQPTTPTSIWDLFSDHLEIYQEGDYMVIETDDIPNHNSPYFDSTHPQYETYNGSNPNFRINPNNITAQNIVFRIPISPTESNNKSNTRLGPIGVALNGVAFFNQYAGPNNQPLTNEVNSFDQYNGHPTGGNVYHYHFEPSYLTTQKGKDALLGVLLDGFPVYGPEENGEILTSDDLDEYHGHTGPTPEFPEGIYHYHFTPDDPYLNGGQYYGTPGTQSN